MNLGYTQLLFYGKLISCLTTGINCKECVNIIIKDPRIIIN